MAEKRNESPVMEVGAEAAAEDWQVLVRWLRAVPDLDQADFAALADLDPSTVSRYENGHLVPRPRSQAKLARAAHVPPFLLETCLLPLIATLRLSSRPADLEDLDEVAAAFLRAFSGVARPRLAVLLLALAQLQASPPAGPPSAADLASADELWERLKLCTPEELEFLIENAPEFQVWALAVRLAEESARAAADDFRRALHLAWLALRIVELSSTEPPFRFTLEGHVRTFFANALRVSSELPEAERELALAKEQVEAGQGTGADLLPAWRRLDLEASLHRARRRWAEALDLLQLARAQAPTEAAGRILLKRSSVLVLMGEGDQAVEVLREAAGLVEDQREPRLLAVLYFNLASTLNLLHRYPEAEALLPEVRERVRALNNGLDLVRYRWLEGQVAAGLGRSEEAMAAFEEVLAKFTEEKIPYDAALVALELAALHLEQGRTSEVKRLAQGMVWIFEEQKVDAETQKALALFREAAAREAVTLDLARRVAAHLARARQAPGLAFEG